MWPCLLGRFCFYELWSLDSGRLPLYPNANIANGAVGCYTNSLNGPFSMNVNPVDWWTIQSKCQQYKWTNQLTRSYHSWLKYTYTLTWYCSQDTIILHRNYARYNHTNNCIHHPLPNEWTIFRLSSIIMDRICLRAHICCSAWSSSQLRDK